MYVNYNKKNACYTVKIFKNKPKNIFKPGGSRPVRRSWIRLCTYMYVF